MSFFKLFRRPKSGFPESFDSLYKTLAHGTDSEIGAHIYRSDLHTPDGLQCSVNGVTFHCRAPEPHGFLIEKERKFSSNGNVVLLIVVPSWRVDHEDNFIPLIVAADKSSPKIAGIVLPFNPLMEKLRGNVCSEIGELSAAWVTRKIKADSVAEGDGVNSVG